MSWRPDRFGRSGFEASPPGREHGGGHRSPRKSISVFCVRPRETGIDRFGSTLSLCGPVGPAEKRAESYDDGQAQDQADEGSTRFGQAGGDQKGSCSSRRVVRAGHLENGQGDAGRTAAAAA